MSQVTKKYHGSVPHLNSKGSFTVTSLPMLPTFKTINLSLPHSFLTLLFPLFCCSGCCCNSRRQQMVEGEEKAKAKEHPAYRNHYKCF